jgi:hypothetical protein
VPASTLARSKSMLQRTRAPWRGSRRAQIFSPGDLAAESRHSQLEGAPREYRDATAAYLGFDRRRTHARAHSAGICDSAAGAAAAGAERSSGLSHRRSSPALMKLGWMFFECLSRAANTIGHCPMRRRDGNVDIAVVGVAVVQNASSPVAGQQPLDARGDPCI